MSRRRAIMLVAERELRSDCAARRSSRRPRSSLRSSPPRRCSSGWRIHRRPGLRCRRRRLPASRRPRPGGAAVRRRKGRARVSPHPRPDAGPRRRGSRRAAAPVRDRLVFRSDVDAKAAAVADTAVRALRRELPPAPELDHRHAPASGRRDVGRSNAGRIRRLPPPAHVSRVLRPVGDQRRRRGEEQPRRRADPVCGPAAPPARRQGDRHRAARLRAADLVAGPQGLLVAASSTRLPSSAATWHS